MSDPLAHFQREEINSITNILNETLSKLKKPNTHFLKPLDHAELQKTSLRSHVRNGNDENKSGEPVPNIALLKRKSDRLSLLNLVGSIR